VAAIEVEGLVVRYGGVTAVDGIALSVEPGEVVALLGPNGAGKTTTVETLEGYRRPAAGRVRVLGLDPLADRRRLAPAVGVMLQEGGTYPVLSPARALRLFASYYDDARDPGELLALTGLEEVASTPAKRLSGGERQRLSLALALVGRPRVAFLDEPTAGVDPAGRIAIREIVASLRADGTSVLLTTHELGEAERMADRVVIVDHGRVVAAGRPADLVTTAEEIRFAAPTGIDVAALGERVGARVTEIGPGEYRVAAAATPGLVATVTAWLAEHDLVLADLRAGRQTLEDTFLRLTGGDGQVPRGPE
jgi:ABC-2 type transport system ATP-binding protein